MRRTREHAEQHSAETVAQAQEVIDRMELMLAKTAPLLLASRARVARVAALLALGCP